MQARSSFASSALSRDLSAGSGKQERETRNEEGNQRVYIPINTTQEERRKRRDGSRGRVPKRP